jgi:hypothetical protein
MHRLCDRLARDGVPTCRLVANAEFGTCASSVDRRWGAADPVVPRTQRRSR